MKEELNQSLKQYDAVEYNGGEQFTITITDDIDAMKRAYRQVPIVKAFVNKEIGIKREYIHGLDPKEITMYEVTGFFFQHQGEEYMTTVEDATAYP